MSGPNSAPEVGQQNYRTPETMLAATRRRLGITQFDWDCACTEEDSVGALGGYFFPHTDALAQDWSELADPEITGFFNPPFAQSGAFCAKAAASGARIVGLVPVAIGTRWWRMYVHRHAVVVGCGRIVFNNPDGTPVLSKDGNPQAINRDCALLAYNILPTDTEWYLLEDWKQW